MKKILNFLVISLIFGFTSFAQDGEQNALLPDKQVVHYSVNLQNDSMPELVENHFPDTTFIKTLSNDVFSGKVQAYESLTPMTIYTNHKISTLDTSYAKRRMGYDSDTIAIQQPDGSIKKKTRESPIEYEDINELLFTESWEFNVDKFTFHKEVLAVSPIREWVDQERGQVRKAKTFTLDYRENIKDKKVEEMKKRIKLVKQITYEISLKHLMDNNLPEAPYFTEISKINLLKTVFDKIKKGEITAYDFHDTTSLTWEQVKTRMEADNDTIRRKMKTENGKEEIKKLVRQRHIRYDEIKSLYFIEKWFIDPATLKIEKEVIGIAPVWQSSDKIRKWKAKDEEGWYHYGIQYPNKSESDNKKPEELIPFVVYFD